MNSSLEEIFLMYNDLKDKDIQTIAKNLLEGPTDKQVKSLNIIKLKISNIRESAGDGGYGMALDKILAVFDPIFSLQIPSPSSSVTSCGRS